MSKRLSRDRRSTARYIYKQFLKVIEMKLSKTETLSYETFDRESD